MTKTDLKQLSKNFLTEDSESFRETFSELIRTYGIKDLARDTGFNRISLWRYMNGGQDIRLATFISILRVLGISVTFHADDADGRMVEYRRLQKKMQALEASIRAGMPDGKTESI